MEIGKKRFKKEFKEIGKLTPDCLKNMPDSKLRTQLAIFFQEN